MYVDKLVICRKKLSSFETINVIVFLETLEPFSIWVRKSKVLGLYLFGVLGHRKSYILVTI